MRKSAVACAIDMALLERCRDQHVSRICDELQEPFGLRPGAVIAWARQNGKTRLRDAWLKARGLS